MAAALLSALGGESLAASPDVPVRLELTELTAAGLSVTDRSVHGMMLAVCVNGEYRCFHFLAGIRGLQCMCLWPAVAELQLFKGFHLFKKQVTFIAVGVC